MQDELEIVGTAAAGAVARDIDGDGFLDGPCPNCGVLLDGEYCSSCGQSAKDLQQPIFTLLKDIFDSVLSIDGRAWKTIPALLFRPGHVTRSYIDGKRARYVPPFRLFLLSSVAFFLLIFGMVERTGFLDGDDIIGGNGAREAIADIQIEGERLGRRDGFDDIFSEDGSLDMDEVVDFLADLSEDVDDFPPEEQAEMVEVIKGMERVSASRQEIFNAVQIWAPRVSFLLVPFNIVILTLLHFWIRRIYIYNHVVVALHMQTFLYLAASLAILLSNASPGWAWSIFGISIPIYFYRIMRKSYDTGRILTVFRTFMLLVLSIVSLSLVIAAVAVLGANEAGLVDWSTLSFGEDDNFISVNPAS
ncbi:MAG: DUF3667 domain-containing protein [Pseudomonadota bacterium]